MSTVNKFAMGLRGQKESENFLRKSGYKILEQNYRSRTGEIDIIAQRGTYIMFIEVKSRTNFNFGLPRESVSGAKQKKIISTAMHYIAANNLENQDFRFDVIEVFNQGGHTYINHIENAFGL